MQSKKPNKNKRFTHVSQVIDLSPHLRRIVVTGDSLKDFPIDQEGSYVKIVLQKEGKLVMRSYTIRLFDREKNELSLDFVINRHQGPATDWAQNAKIGDNIGIAGPGPMKITNYDHHSYLLVGDLTSMNALNGYIPKFKKEADIKAIIAVPNRKDIIKMDYDDSRNTLWFIEDEATMTLEETVLEAAKHMAKDSHVFLGLEARSIRALRPVLQEEIGFDRLNIFAVGYWKKGVNADRFGAEKRNNPV
ncbi:siderophore-interacting protein [Psychromonas arctica]|uniref:siderophore-interacting protein n=1 Tax=Psychromonas arctica TaxID=168275 RepID=UPI0003F73F62|nr:siderophore-interacting protein [Psychromonas arctica]